MNQANFTRRDFFQMCGLSAVGLGLGSVLAGCGGSGSDSSSSSSSSGSGYTLVKKGSLTMISNFYFPPFVSMDDKTGDFEGFDVDVYKDICSRLKLKARILPSVQFDTIVPTIKQGGKADVSIGAITITDDRKKEIDFSTPYLDSNQSIVVKKGATATTSDQLNAKGMQIAVQSGTTGESWAKENLPKATTVPLDDIIQALTGVQSGLYNACVADLPVTSYEIKQAYSDLEIPEGGEIATGEQYGIVVSKKNPNLTKAINKALKAMKKDGTMKKLEIKWFGQEV